MSVSQAEESRGSASLTGSNLNDMSIGEGSQTEGQRRRKPKRGICKKLQVEVDDFMQRAEQYFDNKDGEQNKLTALTKHYREQNVAFRNILRSARLQMYEKVRTGEIEDSEQALRALYMDNVNRYYNNITLIRGAYRLNRNKDFTVSREEYNEAHKHFCSENRKYEEPLNKVENYRLVSLKGKYRRALGKNPNDDKILRLMEKRKWTMDDIKRKYMPSEKDLLDFIQERRLIRGTHTASSSIVRGNRSNPEVDIDLNENFGSYDNDADLAA